MILTLWLSASLSSCVPSAVREPSLDDHFLAIVCREDRPRLVLSRLFFGWFSSKTAVEAANQQQSRDLIRILVTWRTLHDD